MHASPRGATAALALFAATLFGASHAAEPAKALTAPKAQASAKAQPSPSEGITADKILIGRTGSLSGVNARQGNGASAGIQAMFDEQNAHGGVCGRSLELIAIDDGYDPARAKKAAAKLIKDEKVFAMIVSNGSGPTQAILPIITEAKIPLIGSTSGAIMRDGKNSRYFFNARNSNYDDARGITSYLDFIGDRTLALVYQDDAFGKSALADFERAAKEDHIEITGKIAMAATTENADATVEKLMAEGGARSHNVAMLLVDKPTANVIKAIRKAKLLQRIYAITSSGEFEREAGKVAAANVIVSQSFPSVTDAGHPTSRQFRELMDARAPGYRESVVAMEGFITANILIEGLKATCGSLSREHLVDALETFKNKPIVGMYYTYDTPAHEGTHYTEPFMWRPDGRQDY